MTWGIHVGRLAVCLLLVLSLNFALPRLMPGDPVLMVLGPDSVALSHLDYEALRREYGLDRPVWEQFGRYWMELASFRLGYSYFYRRSVGELIWEHLGRTLCLVVPAVFLSTIIAAVFGTIAGWKRGSILDLSLTALALLAYAMPAFLTAMILLDACSIRHHGFSSPALAPDPDAVTAALKRFFRWLRHTVLPITVLTVTSAGAKYLVMRKAVAATRDEPHVFYARARGLSWSRVVFAHVFLKACLPLLHLSALHLGFVVSGAVLVEIVFSINGMGCLILDAVLRRDYPVLQGSFLVLTLVVLFMNALMDWISALLDPRLRP